MRGLGQRLARRVERRQADAVRGSAAGVAADDGRGQALGDGRLRHGRAGVAEAEHDEMLWWMLRHVKPSLAFAAAAPPRLHWRHNEHAHCDGRHSRSAVAGGRWRRRMVRAAGRRRHRDGGGRPQPAADPAGAAADRRGRRLRPLPRHAQHRSGRRRGLCRNLAGGRRRRNRDPLPGAVQDRPRRAGSRRRDAGEARRRQPRGRRWSGPACTARPPRHG